MIDFKLAREEGKSERVAYKDLGRVIVEDIKSHGLEQKALTVGVEISASLGGGDFS